MRTNQRTTSPCGDYLILVKDTPTTRFRKIGTRPTRASAMGTVRRLERSSNFYAVITMTEHDWRDITGHQTKPSLPGALIISGDAEAAGPHGRTRSRSGR